MGFNSVFKGLMAHTHTSTVCAPETTYCPFDPHNSSIQHFIISLFAVQHEQPLFLTRLWLGRAFSIFVSSSSLYTACCCGQIVLSAIVILISPHSGVYCCYFASRNNLFVLHSVPRIYSKLPLKHLSAFDFTLLTFCLASCYFKTEAKLVEFEMDNRLLLWTCFTCFGSWNLQWYLG